MTDDKDNIQDAEIVDINEYAAKKFDADRLEEVRKQHEYEQNFILTPLWEALTSIKTGKQAISASMGMLIAAKDILVLELGKEQAKVIIGTLDFDTIDLVSIEKRPMGSNEEVNYDIRSENDEPLQIPDSPANDNIVDINENTNLEFTKTERGDDDEESTD